MKSELVERARFLAAGQDDPHSVTISDLCDEIERLRAALKEAAEMMDGEGLAAADHVWEALGLEPPHTQR